MAAVGKNKTPVSGFHSQKPYLYKKTNSIEHEQRESLHTQKISTDRHKLKKNLTMHREGSNNERNSQDNNVTNSGSDK